MPFDDHTSHRHSERKRTALTLADSGAKMGWSPRTTAKRYRHIGSTVQRKTLAALVDAPGVGFRQAVTAAEPDPDTDVES